MLVTSGSERVKVKMLGPSIEDLVFQAFSLWVCLLPRQYFIESITKTVVFSKLKLQTDTSFNYFASFYVYTADIFKRNF